MEEGDLAFPLVLLQVVADLEMRRKEAKPCRSEVAKVAGKKFESKKQE